MSRSGIDIDKDGNLIHIRSGEILQIWVDKPFGHGYFIDPPISTPVPYGCSHKENYGRTKPKLCSSTNCPLEGYNWFETWYQNRQRCKYAIYAHYEKNKLVRDKNPYKKKKTPLVNTKQVKKKEN